MTAPAQDTLLVAALRYGQIAADAVSNWNMQNYDSALRDLTNAAAAYWKEFQQGESAKP